MVIREEGVTNFVQKGREYFMIAALGDHTFENRKP